MFLQLHRVLNSVRERVFIEADQRAGQRAIRLAIEVVKLLVKPLVKLYQTGPSYVERGNNFSN
jgi:hypothetical protein